MMLFLGLLLLFFFISKKKLLKNNNFVFQSNKQNKNNYLKKLWKMSRSHPRIMASHKRMLLSVGAPLTPAGGSSWSLEHFGNKNLKKYSKLLKKKL